MASMENYRRMRLSAHGHRVIDEHVNDRGNGDQHAVSEPVEVKNWEIHDRGMRRIAPVCQEIFSLHRNRAAPVWRCGKLPLRQFATCTAARAAPTLKTACIRLEGVVHTAPARGLRRCIPSCCPYRSP